ncbi:tRNA 2'-phosphotransferase 1-like [Mya arenaria]|uniref:tRNA 2'-phosphotransferase 1-like n=1 Tax=Mya arenaria TaxID=6604 RepID=UPI0022E78346|nr:tRNA 2'-phosphotransferase 1-like [Mya arenaria]
MSLNSLSHFLAKLLRHEAQARGLHVSRDGYVDVEDVLQEAKGRVGTFTASHVRSLVDNDNKGRFKLKNEGGKMYIKATQGHSFTFSDSELIPIRRSLDVRGILHGTKRGYWPSIQLQGLSRKGRAHIHFAQGETGVKSGFPPHCDMAIEINLALALQDGIKFYKSENDVILSPGNDQGLIPAKYFKSAYVLSSRQPLL